MTQESKDRKTNAGRRTFMKSLGAGAAAVGGLATLGYTKAGLAADDLSGWLGQGSRNSMGFWSRVKSEFMLDPAVTYMNVGTTGSTPRRFVKAHDRYYRNVAADPRETLGGSTAMRARIARHFGCDTSELVISGNTTDGMCMTLNGLTLGDDSY